MVGRILIWVAALLVISCDTLELCQRCPACDFHYGFVKPSYCWLPDMFGSPTPEDMIPSIKECLEFHMGTIVGQDHVKTRLRSAIIYKLRHPESPLRLHFGGDNGVGKTFTAFQISLATSRRLHSSCGSKQRQKMQCEKGENLLHIQAASFRGRLVKDSRDIIVKEVISHLRQYPFGIILFDDLSAIPPSERELMQQLAPLFGRGSHFPEAPDVDLNRATVIVTSDFDQEGKALKHATIEDLEHAIRRHADDVYQMDPSGEMKTLGFFSLDTEGIVALIRHHVTRLPCREPRIVSAKIDDLGVDWFLTDGVIDKDKLAKHSGRYVRQVLHEHVDEVVSTHLFDTPLDSALVVRISIGSDGWLEVRFQDAALQHSEL